MWEVIFMLLILKIPLVYLCAVVLWAIRAEPRPDEGALRLARIEPTPPCDWHRSPRRSTRPLPRPKPSGLPARRAVALARASRRS
jgi:hypothetical protein